MDQLYLNSNNAYTELTAKIIRSEINRQISEEYKVLDFSAEQYSLLRIGIFQTLSVPIRDQIMEINVSNNRLIQINQINVFKNLIKLDVHNNRINFLDLTSPSLTHVDASFNDIEVFPKLLLLTKLTHLNLSGNRIMTLFVDNVENLQEIIDLNISSNQIKFKSGCNIKAIIMALIKLKNLLNLDFSLNPFVIKEYTIVIYFVVVLKQLKMINKKSMEQMTNDANRIILQSKKNYDLSDLDSIELDENSEDEQEEGHGQHNEIQIFEQLNNRLEICLKDPSKITDQLRTLKEKVESIVSTQPDKWQEMFSSNDPDKNNKIEEQLDNFLQNCFLLCQNQQYYIKEVLVLFVQLAVIPHRQFGKRCFEQFVEVIKSGRGMAKIAKDLLQQYSVPQIQRQEKLLNVPPQVMEGIVRCIQERPESELVPVQLVENFERWLGQSVLNYKNKNDKLRDDQLNIDLILLSLVDELAKNPKYLKNYRKHKISSYLLIIFKFLLKRNFFKHQIKILSAMESVFMFDAQTSHEILSLRNQTQNFVKDLENELSSNIFMFKQFNNSMINPETKENREYIQLKYDNFEALIRCYGALMLRNEYDLLHYKQDVLMNEMFSICTVTGLHPKLLNGLVLFVSRLLENEYMIKSNVSSDYVEFIGKGIQNGTPFIQYLGGTSYIPMMKQLGDNQHVSKNLTYQINPIIQDLFKNIVNLIGFFSLKSINQNSNISGICSEISMQLNKNNREDALFLTLATPNDNVRLAIVRCLLTIKTDQLDTKEVSHLVGLLPMYSNLGAGKTEAIISNIMMILTKLICSNKQAEIDTKSEIKVLHDFITIYSENAIKDSLAILVKNMDRDLRMDPEENFEKMELSVGVVNFLKSMGLDEELRTNLKGFDQAKFMKISLILEEKYVDPHLVSVEIERTWIGKYCEHLLMALCGKESLFPFGKVWERIFIRMAENLEGKAEDIPEDLSDLNGIYNGRKIINNIISKNTKRTEQNLDIWDVMKFGLSKVVRKWDDKSKQSNEYQYLESQHKLFAESEAVYNLLNYTLGRNQNTEATELDQYFRKQIFTMLNYDKQVNSIKHFINEALYDQIVLMDPKRNHTKPKPKLTQQVQLYQSILNAEPTPFDPLRGSNLKPPHMSALVLKPLTKVSRTIKQVRGRLDHEDENEGILPSQRIITVSAYLRIVYSMLVFSPLEASRVMVADQIARSLEYLKELTFVCQWAQWGEGNIASKYLKIINVVLDLSVTCRKSQFIKGYFIISNVLQTVLNIVEFKLNDDDKCPQTTEDKILISEICECFGRIIMNIKHISFDDDIRSQSESETLLDGKGFDALRKISIASHEYFMILIMPLKSFKIYLHIMTWDMRLSQRMSRDQIASNDSQEVMKSIRNWLQYVLGAYIVECQSIRKEISRLIVEFEVFHKQYIRYSFIQGFLDMSFNVLYQEKFREQLNDTIFGQKINDYSTSNHIIFLQRCFLQEQFKHNGSFTSVVLLLLETSLLIIQVHEIINHKEDINSASFITIKSHKVLLRVPTDQIDALYRMESMQRVVLVYQLKVKGPYSHDDGLQASIIFMREVDAISNLILEARRLKIAIYSDFISEGSIRKFLVDQPIVLLWCVKDPSQPLLDRHSEFTSNKKCLVAVMEKKIVVLHDHLEEWYWTNPKRFTVNSTLSSKQRGFKSAKELRDRTVANLFYSEKKDYPFDKLSTIRMEQSLNSVITLYFGKDKLTLLLGCDTAREQLKKALIQCVGEIDSFQVHNKQLI